jgi:hypothetical protein
MGSPRMSCPSMPGPVLRAPIAVVPGPAIVMSVVTVVRVPVSIPAPIKRGVPGPGIGVTVPIRVAVPVWVPVRKVHRITISDTVIGHVIRVRVREVGIRRVRRRGVRRWLLLRRVRRRSRLGRLLRSEFRSALHHARDNVVRNTPLFHHYDLVRGGIVRGRRAMNVSLYYLGSHSGVDHLQNVNHPWRIRGWTFTQRRDNVLRKNLCSEE